MPLPPTNPLGTPDKTTENVSFAAVGTAGNDLTTEVLVAPRDGYLTAARLIPVGAAAFDATNNRTWAIVDATTLSLTDGCIVDPAVGKGPWVSTTAYTTGQWVTLNNLPYVCIVNITGSTGPGVDTSHWQQIASPGLHIVNTLSTAVTQDFVGAGISDSGNTDIPASTFIGAIKKVGSATAIIMSSVAPGPTTADGGPGNVTLTQGPVTQPTAFPAAATTAVTGTAVISRTCTVGASRTLATFTCSTVSLAAGTEVDLVLSTTDTKVYRGDVVKLTSTHNAAGVADPGGTLQLELTSYDEGLG